MIHAANVRRSVGSGGTREGQRNIGNGILVGLRDLKFNLYLEASVWKSIWLLMLQQGLISISLEESNRGGRRILR
jgi:hypothetical protein